ncbi:MAG TPA: hypothetical protein VMY88_04500 [Acidimicrobiales bacterium]|nr:hypothetical protein [Acidimicrobiales bacterium]
MAQPEYVPGKSPAHTRRGALVPGEVLPGHPGWKPRRPGDHVPGEAPPSGAAFGSPGPDQGYALLLAKRFIPRLELTPGENADDAIAGCLGIALRRASLFHRAPVYPDLELAFGIWGFLTPDPPEDLIALRKRLFDSAAHHYWDQRGIAGHIPEPTLRLRPEDALARVRTEWRAFVGEVSAPGI